MPWPKWQDRKDWQEEVARMLIEGSTDGVKQSIITKRFDHWVDVDDVVNELEALAAQNKAQKFIIRGRGRPATIWRATTEILKP